MIYFAIQFKAKKLIIVTKKYYESSCNMKLIVHLGKIFVCSVEGGYTLTIVPISSEYVYPGKNVRRSKDSEQGYFGER